MPLLATAALLVLALFAVPAHAQATLSHTEDAAPVPEGMLRFRVVTAWTRADDRFTPNGLVPLGTDFSADALGPTQLPLLAPAWAGLQTLTANPSVRLSLGRLDVGSNARIVTTPISLEYGLTSRLTLGIVVPIVQTRRVARAHVNEDTSAAYRGTVAYVPVGARSTAANTNLAFATAYQRAADSLGARITRCQQNPAGADCGGVNANAAAAAAARAQAQSFAAAARALGADAAHAIVAPLGNTALADSIEARRILLNQQLVQLLGAGYGATTSVYTAPYRFTYIDLQGNDAAGTPGLLQSPLGGGLDSVYTTDRLGIGDISISAQYLLFDRFQRDSLPVRGLQTRLAVGGAWRFNTSRPDTTRNLTDIRTGDGSGVELHSVMDLIMGHFGSTVGARYLKSFGRKQGAPLFGDPAAPWPYPLFGTRSRTAGTVMGLDLTPRVLVDQAFSIEGHYGIERVGPTTWDTPDVSLIDPCVGCVLPAVVTESGTTTTAQRLGIGFRYSTVDAFFRRQARYPVEVSFTHLTTITGDPGLERISRDQIQVRLYYRLLGR
ncbi:MAG: hypothetical protein ACJ8AD_13930 [Gemmatimonadaceae bacterium]